MSSAFARNAQVVARVRREVRPVVDLSRQRARRRRALVPRAQSGHRQEDHLRRLADPDVRGDQEPQGGDRVVRADGAQWAAERHEQEEQQGARTRSPSTRSSSCTRSLTPEEKAKGNPYRKDNPLHRLYFHEIAQPDKIAMRMKKLVEWLDEDETQHMHPVERAARAHYPPDGDLPVAEELGQGGAPADEPDAAARRLPAGRHPQHRAPALLRRAARRDGRAWCRWCSSRSTNGVETAIRFFEELEEAASPAQARLVRLALQSLSSASLSLPLRVSFRSPMLDIAHAHAADSNRRSPTRPRR